MKIDLIRPCSMTIINQSSDFQWFQKQTYHSQVTNVSININDVCSNN